MARVLEEEIHSHHDLDLLIHHLPPELASATDAELGAPAIMSPAAVLIFWYFSSGTDQRPGTANCCAGA